MASEMIGRCVCPECGFQAAHVKIKTDKEGAHPYRHCPDCGAQFFPRNKVQADNLRATIRGAAQPAPVPEPKADPAPEPKNEPAPVPAKKTKVVFGVRMPA